MTAGEQKRDFVYIDDVVAAFRLLVNRSCCLPGGFNELGLGSGETVSIRDFVEIARSFAKSSTALRFGALPYRTHEVMSHVSIAALVALGWSPKVGLTEGLRKPSKRKLWT